MQPLCPFFWQEVKSTFKTFNSPIMHNPIDFKAVNKQSM
jgi:hypothetical protein